MSNPYIGKESREQKTLEPNHQNPFGSSVPSQQQETKPPRNILAILALVVAALGLIFACIPGTLLIGAVLLPIAFVMALVSFFLDGTKGFSVAAVIVSIIGAVAAALIFSNGADSADREASLSAASDNPATEGGAPGDAVDAADYQKTTSGDGTATETSTRENPYPVGTTVNEDEWSVTVNEVTLDATQEVLAGFEFNEAPPTGSQYLMVNITTTYNGTDPQGEMPFPFVEYVTTGGNAIPWFNEPAIPPNQFDSSSTLYEGASTTGNLVFTVPTESAAEGVLSVQPNSSDDKTFVALQ